VIDLIAFAPKENMQPPIAEPGFEAWPLLSAAPAAQSRPGEPPHIAWLSGNNRSPSTPAARSSRGIPQDERPLAA